MTGLSVPTRLDPEPHVADFDEPRESPSRRWIWPAAFCVGLFLVTMLAYSASKKERPLIAVAPPPSGEAVPDLLPPNPVGETALLYARWAEPIARRTGIPQRSLMAYANAVQLAHRRDPGCGISWTTLAGIASKESANGEHGNARIAPNGDVRPKIRGHALDGTDGTVVMLDTYEPSADGSPVYVQAKGPFQIIPETWDRNKTDGNGDGRYDPDNIDDAAATAAHYLCTRGGDMTTPRGWRNAIHAYNSSPYYLLDVRRRAATYADGFGSRA